jgi:Zn-dependent peptidase ImmA (M78 family)/predicted secreted protein
MADVRKAILRGKREAGRLHRQFNIRDRIMSDGGRIDVFDTIIQSGLPLLFKPLDGLLGVYMDDPTPGVLVTTKRPLSVQRFTGAHELGHYKLEHQPSLDDESLLRRSPFNESPNYKQQELEADAFATEFMLPPWLFASHFSRQGWSPGMMADPLIVYQLSLRVGASYDATCRSLVRPGIEVINRATLNKILKVKPKDIKKALLAKYQPPDYWGDVWLLTEKDEGTVIEGSRSDLFVLRLTEHSNSGYIWNFEQLNKEGFAIVRDEREASESEFIGSYVTRSITTRASGRQKGHMVLAERRPWLKNSEPLSKYYIEYNLFGPEEDGWSQAERRRVLEAA